MPLTRRCWRAVPLVRSRTGVAMTAVAQPRRRRLRGRVVVVPQSHAVPEKRIERAHVGGGATLGANVRLEAVSPHGLSRVDPALARYAGLHALLAGRRSRLSFLRLHYPTDVCPVHLHGRLHPIPLGLGDGPPLLRCERAAPFICGDSLAALRRENGRVVVGRRPIIVGEGALGRHGWAGRIRHACSGARSPVVCELLRSFGRYH